MEKRSTGFFCCCLFFCYWDIFCFVFLELSEIVWGNFTSYSKAWTPLIPIVLFAMHLRGEWKELPLEQFEFQVHFEELQTWLQIMFGKGLVTWTEKKSNRKQELLMVNRASLLLHLMCEFISLCFFLQHESGFIKLRLSLYSLTYHLQVWHFNLMLCTPTYCV